MIKPGQIYNIPHTQAIIIVTRIYQKNTDNGYETEACCLYRNGFVCTWNIKLMKNFILKAEYPTWQEAVNSPEFTGEKETLGTKLKTLRDERNLSLKDVSNATHISKSYLWNIERDNRTMSVKILSKLAVFYGVSPNYLLGF